MPGYDAHCHLDQVDDIDAVVARARAAGVTGWCLAAGDPQRWNQVVATARQTGGQVALGVHPWWVDAAWPEHLARIPEDVDAIGESGLDHRCDVDRGLQRASLRAHLALARERDLPVVLHCVKAAPELIRVLQQDGAPRGFVHGWTGSVEQTAALVSLGLHLSVGTDVVRWSNPTLSAMLAVIPDNRLLLETDAPERPLRDGLGEPADLRQVAKVVAAARGGTAEDWMSRTAQTAQLLWRP